jgi:hypothetical protein
MAMFSDFTVLALRHHVTIWPAVITISMMGANGESYFTLPLMDRFKNCYAICP